MTLRRYASYLITLVLFLTPAFASWTRLIASEGEFDRRDGSYKTANFRTYAATPELAREFGDRAEIFRRQKAMEWLGEEMPNWPERCPLRVDINMKTPGGATTFQFGAEEGRSAVLEQRMKIWGEKRQLLESVLPHEVTHTVLAYRFRQAVPRWADEGGSVLSENADEWFTHDIRCREILNAGRGITLRVLFTLTQYPPDVIVVYAQGYSICSFLVNEHEGGRRRFLEFVEMGMRNNSRNWEQAVREVYGYKSVDDLEARWIESLRSPPRRADVAKANATRPSASTPTAEIASRGRTEIRSSGLPGVAMLEPPVLARGMSPDREERRAQFPDTSRPAPRSSGQMGVIPTARPVEAPPPIRLLLPPEPPRR